MGVGRAICPKKVLGYSVIFAQPNDNIEFPRFPPRCRCCIPQQCSRLTSSSRFPAQSLLALCSCLSPCAATHALGALQSRLLRLFAAFLGSCAASSGEFIWMVHFSM